MGGDLVPDIEEVAPAHRTCNLRHGGRLGNAKKYGSKPSKPKPRPKVVPLTPPPSTPAVEPTGWDHLHGASNVDMSTIPDEASPPRLFSPPHPDAVGSYATELVPVIEARMKAEGRSLRWWQRQVLIRAWEYDAAGKLVWDRVVVSSPRQVGKSVLLLESAIARCSSTNVFADEPQSSILVSRAVTAASMVHMQAWSWAAREKLEVRRRFGSETLTWSNGSKWLVSSLASIYGQTASQVHVDEGWDVEPRAFTRGVLPTLSARHNSQAWIVSTANDDATDLVPAARIDAAKVTGTPRTMLAEWSAPAGADPSAMESYRLASPHWDAGRERLIEGVIGTPDSLTQFLNIWPGADRDTPVGWPAGWADCGAVEGMPPAGGVGALEVDLERRSCGVAVAVGDGAHARLWTSVAPSLDAALLLLRTWHPSLVLVGASLHDQVARGDQAPWVWRGAGGVETKVSSPALLAAVRDGRVAHNHDQATLAQVRDAVAILVESGPVLSGRRSRGPIAALKAASWALLGVLEAQAPDQPAIY